MTPKLGFLCLKGNHITQQGTEHQVRTRMELVKRLNPCSLYHCKSLQFRFSFKRIKFFHALLLSTPVSQFWCSSLVMKAPQGISQKKSPSALQVKTLSGGERLQSLRFPFHRWIPFGWTVPWRSLEGVERFPLATCSSFEAPKADLTVLTCSYEAPCNLRAGKSPVFLMGNLKVTTAVVLNVSHIFWSAFQKGMLMTYKNTDSAALRLPMSFTMVLLYFALVYVVSCLLGSQFWRNPGIYTKLK